MAYRDYTAPGVSVIVERQKGEEVKPILEYHPVYVGTGMTSKSRVLSFDGIGVDTSAFPIVELTINFKNLLNSQIYNITEYTIQALEVVLSGTPQPLLVGVDYNLVTPINSVDADGNATFKIEILANMVAETDLVYNVDVKVDNTEDDFDLRLIYSEDQFSAREIFGPHVLNEGGAEFFNDIAIAADIAFKAKAPKFYYLEVPRTFGSKAVAADYKKVFEKIFYKDNAYRVVPLTDDEEVAEALRDFVEDIANPTDKRETVGFVTYPVSSIVKITDLVELKTKIGGFSDTLNSKRVMNVFTGDSLVYTLDRTDYTLDPYFMNVAITAIDARLGMASPLSLRNITAPTIYGTEVNIFKKVNLPRFRPKQWNELAKLRVWIMTRDEITETVSIRHQLTTANSEFIEDQEYSLVKNIDAINRLLRERMEPYAGKYSIVEGYFEKIDASLTSAIEEIKEMKLAKELRVISPWSSAVIPDLSNGTTTESKQRLVTRLQFTPAYPANNLDIYLLL